MVEAGTFFRPAVPKLQLAPWLVAALTGRAEPDILPDGTHALRCGCFDCMYGGQKTERSWIE